MRLLRIGEPAPAFAQGGGQPYANDGRNLGQHHPAGAAASHALAPLLPGERPQAQPLPQQLRGVSWLCRNLSGLKWLGEGGGGVVFQVGVHCACISFAWRTGACPRYLVPLLPLASFLTCAVCMYVCHLH